MKELLLGIARHAGTIVAGYLVTQGYIDSSDTQMVVGVVIGVASVGYSIYDKMTRRK